MASTNAPAAAGRIPVHFNDQPLDLPAGCTVAALLERQGLAGRRVAVEVNREIVPRSAHAARTLVAGDRVEVVHALGGG
jgi:sulfur carrier protein